MFFKFKNHYKYIFFTFFIILNSCQLQEPTKNHGILFLENRAKKIVINENNKNDIIKLIGQPHTKSIPDEDSWIYIERVLSKGAYHKLGKTVLKTNNVLILTFDKYGILVDKNLLNKNDINKMRFTKKITENNLTKQSFVQSFLASVKAKMYQNRK
jgi:outer membrane protein assembly factor BamE (lipoprotein component of BamABCDE complex)